MKTNTTNNTNTNNVKVNKTNNYKKVSKGVYQYGDTFIVKKMSNGRKISKAFTGIRAAKSFYKGL